MNSNFFTKELQDQRDALTCFASCFCNAWYPLGYSNHFFDYHFINGEKKQHRDHSMSLMCVVQCLVLKTGDHINLFLTLNAQKRLYSFFSPFFNQAMLKDVLIFLAVMS